MAPEFFKFYFLKKIMCQFYLKPTKRIGEKYQVDLSHLDRTHCTADKAELITPQEIQTEITYCNTNEHKLFYWDKNLPILYPGRIFREDVDFSYPVRVLYRGTKINIIHLDPVEQNPDSPLPSKFIKNIEQYLLQDPYKEDDDIEYWSGLRWVRAVIIKVLPLEKLQVQTKIRKNKRQRKTVVDIKNTRLVSLWRTKAIT